MDETQEPKKSNKTAIGAVIGVIALLLAKSKGILVLLKGLSSGKVLLSLGSMLAMVWVLARESGWWFGVGFVLMLLIHELGHGWAIKREGLSAGYPIFIPFLGAMIALKGQPRNSLVEARIAIAGPMAGTAAALGATSLYLATDQRLYLAIAYSGYFLNLFNLVPISPLDGGRVAKMFSRRIWILGLALLAGLALVHLSIPLIIIGLFALMNSLRPQPPGPDEHEVSQRDRVNMAANYFGLAAFLAVGMYFAGILLHQN